MTSRTLLGALGTLLTLATLASLGATLCAQPRRRSPRPRHHTTATTPPPPAPTPPVAPPPVVQAPMPANAGPRVTVTGRFPTRTGRFTAPLTVDGESRDVELVVPARRDPHAPLLVLLHGTNGAGGQIIDEGGVERFANDHGIVVVAPTSRWRSARDWDHPEGESTYWETAPNRDPDRNPDLALVRAAINLAQSTYATDTARTYVAGHSNGAFFALFVAMIFHDRIAAFAENSGGMVRCGTTPSCHFAGRGTTCAALSQQRGYCACTGPSLPTDVVTTGYKPAAYLGHGTDDPMVTVAYTCELSRALTAAGYEVSVSLRDGEGHALPETFIPEAWPFLSRHRLP